MGKCKLKSVSFNNSEINCRQIYIYIKFQKLLYITRTCIFCGIVLYKKFSSFFSFLFPWQCSAGCGLGMQRRPVTCKHILTGRAGNTCDTGSKPASARKCRLKECKKIGGCF